AEGLERDRHKPAIHFRRQRWPPQHAAAVIADTFEGPTLAELIEERTLERPRLVPGRCEDTGRLLRRSKPRPRHPLIVAYPLDREFEVMFPRFDVTHITVDLIARNCGLLDQLLAHLGRQPLAHLIERVMQNPLDLLGAERFERHLKLVEAARIE